MVPIPKISAGSRRTPVGSHELSPENFAPLGEVIQNPATHGGLPRLESTVANQGSATKWLDVTHMTDFYDRASSGKASKTVVNMFVCKPRVLQERDGRKVFPVEILERHPFTPQTFVPLGVSSGDESTRYLVIVAPTLPEQRKPSLLEKILGTQRGHAEDDVTTTTSTADSGRKGPGLPDLDNIKAFVARVDQAVTYSAGTWHAPMVVLGDKDIEFVVLQHANGVAEEDCREVVIEVGEGGDGLAIDVGNTVGTKAKL